VQKPHPPIVIGGMSRPAARRAVARGDGWYGFFTNPELTARSLGWIRDAIAAGERRVARAARDQRHAAAADHARRS
jgi:alkanesulfonate monooxygenase SsuD/methylene tetrahydromethanopterin reductase-like flavin-dependent oxidoreductase (luciferase family)